MILIGLLFFFFKGFTEALQEARKAAGCMEPSLTTSKTSEVCLSAVTEKSSPGSSSASCLSGFAYFFFRRNR